MTVNAKINLNLTYVRQIIILSHCSLSFTIVPHTLTDIISPPTTEDFYSLTNTTHEILGVRLSINKGVYIFPLPQKTTQNAVIFV